MIDAPPVEGTWPVQPQMDPSWLEAVSDELETPAMKALRSFLTAEVTAGRGFLPPGRLVFNALRLTPLDSVRVVILGQDPYHGPGQAEGLAFSVAPGVKPPPSLCNIFKEIARGPWLGTRAITPRRDGSLVAWAQQGVLLLNTCLTVEAGQPASHARRGWEALTDEVVRVVASKDKPVVFMLWGAHAQAKQRLIAATAQQGAGATVDHLVLTANHPSPLSARRPPQPFIGCGHFCLANAYLEQHGCAPIAW